MKTALTLWDDTLRVIEFDAIEGNNNNQREEVRSLRALISVSIGELDDPDIDKEEAEWEAGQVIAAVRARVLELIANRGGDRELNKLGCLLNMGE